MNGVIKVSASTLLETSESFRAQAGNVTNLTNSIVEIVSSLACTWEGEASMSYVSRLRGLEDDIGRLAFTIQEYSNALEEIAEQYRLTDMQNMEEILTLPDHII